MTKITKVLGTLGDMARGKRIPYGDRGVVITTTPQPSGRRAVGPSAGRLPALRYGASWGYVLAVPSRRRSWTAGPKRVLTGSPETNPTLS